MLFKITYKHGLQNPFCVYADSVEEAMKLGLANHRKNSGHLETVDNWPADKVIDAVTLLEVK